MNDESLGIFQARVLLSWARGQSSWIRHLGAVWAQPDLWGCTGAMLGVTDIGAGMGATSGTAGVCGFGVTSIAGAAGGGCGSLQD